MVHTSANLPTDTRLKLNFSGKYSYLYSRNVYTRNKATFGFIGAMDIKNNFINKSDFFLGYKVNDQVDVYARAEKE